MKALIPYILMVSAITIGCKKTDFLEQAAIGEYDTQIELTLDGIEMQEGATKGYGLTPTEEKQIKTLDVLVFKASGQLASRAHMTSPASLTNTLTTKSGDGMSVYAIANANIELNASGSPTDALGRVTNITDLKNLKITNMSVDLQANKTLMMSGMSENITINPTGTNHITIPLDYVAAKITVNMINSLPVGDQFDLADWKLGNLARYSYIFPRTTDAVDSTLASDFVTQASTYTWDDATIDVNGTLKAVKTTTFYLFENRRGVTSNTVAANKSGNTAPVRATRMIATGYYKSGPTMTSVNINLMFGENSTNNYNVKRKYQYTYNVTVKGIANIDVDTRYNRGSIGFQADVMSPTLDAHYDFRPLRIMAYPGISTVTILNTNGSSTLANFWLKVSQLNITKFADMGGGNYQRPTYNPATDMRQATTVITSATSGIDTKFIYLYTDEFLTESGLRSALVRVNYIPTNGPAFSTDITITQRGIQLAGNVGLRRIDPVTNNITTTQYKLGYDVINEEALSITPGNLANERTMRMQFGSFGGNQIIALDNKGRRNGFENTLALVFSNINAGTLRAPYGRTGSSTISYATWDPIYNTSAARYCFEKNRDTDGNGKIEGAEIKWYLPSVEEQTLISVGNLAWSPSTADLWSEIDNYSSSQYNAQYIMTTYFPFAQSGLVDGVTTPQTARCVRKM